MKVAVKFWSQSISNPNNFPSEWPWKKIDIIDEEAPEYESSGFTVFSPSDFDEYLRGERGRAYSGYLAQKQSDYKYLEISIAKKIEYAKDLMERLKKKNITENINALQGLWMHQKVRALPVTFYGMSFTIDLMNLVISGDLELACISLMNCPADDMTAPYHWLSTERKDWIITELKKFLGWP